MEKNQTTFRWKEELIAAGLLMAFACLINRGIEIKGLYMDDLYLWSCYGEQSFGEFVFPVGATRFRFIYYLAAWLELAIVRNHITWFVPFHIVLNGCIAYTVYRFGRRLSGNPLVGFWCGFLYLLSRMAYYQIGQVYGLMESLALWAAVGIFYCLYRLLHEPALFVAPGDFKRAFLSDRGKKLQGDVKYFFLACVLYFCICFIHERYMALLPLFYLVLLFRKERRIVRWLAVTGEFVLVLGIRFLTIGTLSPAGTGGTDVAETFRLGDALRYAVSQVLYLFGVNAGPTHLNGCSYAESPAWARISVVAADGILAVFVVILLVRIVKDIWRKRRFAELAWIGKDAAFFLSFIALCIGSSSVTIRVEMRWIYVSLTGAYLFAAWMFGVIACSGNTKNEAGIESIPLRKKSSFQVKRRMAICAGLLACFAIVMVPVEQFYRSQYPNLYLWPNQMRYNSLAEETYGMYGDELFGKQIYLVGNTYQMSDFTARTFFKTFDRARKAEGTKVHRIDSIDEIGQVSPNMVILREDPKRNAYQNITDFVRKLKCDAAYGYYADGWMDENAKLRVLTGRSGAIRLEFYYPGELTGNEVCHITFGDGSTKDIAIRESVTKTELSAEPLQFVEMEFTNNFYYQDALEQRGEKRFSMIVNLTTD